MVVGDVNNSYEANDIQIFSFPSIDQTLINVTITGQLIILEIFSVSSSTSLNNLYKLAGGFKDNASIKGIIISRKFIKDKERQQLRKLLRRFSDVMIAQNIKSLKWQFCTHCQTSQGYYLYLITLNMLRLTGDFQPESVAQQLNP